MSAVLIVKHPTCAFLLLYTGVLTVLYAAVNIRLLLIDCAGEL